MDDVNLKTQQAILLKKLRHQQGLTQQQLAELSGVGLSSIKELETDIRMARIETLFRLANGLNIDPSLLFLPLWDIWKGNHNNILKALDYRQRK